MNQLTSVFRTNKLAFEIAMWAYLIAVTAGICYAWWNATSFLPALRQAQFQFAPLAMSDDTSQYASFFNSVVASWSDRLGAYRPSRSSSLAVVLVFFLSTVAFFVLFRKPKGMPIEQIYGSDTLAGTRLAEARRLADFDGQILERTDFADTAVATRRAIYLPRVLTQRLSRKHLFSVPAEIAFTIRHEMAHSSSSDNLVYSLGSALTVLLVGLVGILFVEPTLFASMMILPNHFISVVPFPLVITVIALMTSMVLAVAAVAVGAVLPNLISSREYFADRAASLDLDFVGLPYLGAYDAEGVGSLIEVWNLGATSPDRRLHSMGIAPRTSALAAAAAAMWISTRTAILMLDWRHGLLAVSIFDAACLLSLMAMLWALPKPVSGARSYGVFPCIATTSLLLIEISLFWVIRNFLVSYGMSEIISSSLILEVGTLPTIVVGVIVAGMTWIRSAQGTLMDIDKVPPRPIGMAFPVILLSSIPSFVASYFLGSLALFVLTTSLSAWIVNGVGDIGGRVIIFASMIALLLILVLLLVLVAKNLSSPNRWSSASEIFIVAFPSGAYYYENSIIASIASQHPPENAGDPVDYTEVLRVSTSFSMIIVERALVVIVVIAAVVLTSWFARYRLTRKSSNSTGV